VETAIRVPAAEAGGGRSSLATKSDRNERPSFVETWASKTASGLPFVYSIAAWFAIVQPPPGLVSMRKSPILCSRNFLEASMRTPVPKLGGPLTTPRDDTRAVGVAGVPVRATGVRVHRPQRSEKT
jgi:hypothetical protein